MADKQKLLHLDEVAASLLEQLAEHHGTSESAIMRMAIREKAQRDLGAAPPPAKPKSRKKPK